MLGSGSTLGVILIPLTVCALSSCSGGAPIAQDLPASSPSEMEVPVSGTPQTAEQVVRGINVSDMFPGGELGLSAEEKALVPGKSYKVYTLSDEAVRRYQPGQRVEDLLGDTNQVIYTLEAGGDPLMAVELAQRGDGGWEFQGVGTNGPPIARGIGKEERVLHERRGQDRPALPHEHRSPILHARRAPGAGGDDVRLAVYGARRADRSAAGNSHTEPQVSAVGLAR